MSVADMRRDVSEAGGVEGKYIPHGVTDAKDIHWTSSFFNLQRTND